MSVMIPEAAIAADSGAAAGGSSLRAAASRKAGSSAAANRGAGSPAAKRAASRVAAPKRAAPGSGGGGAGGGGSQGKAPAPARKSAVKKPPTTVKKTVKSLHPRKPVPKRVGGGKKSGGGKSSGRSFALPKDSSKLVLAEFVICIVILILSPLTSKGSKDLDKGGAVDMTLKATALAFVFFVLALVSAGGPTASKVAASFGGIITLGYVVSQGDVFATISKLWANPTATGLGAGTGAAAGT